MFQLLDENGSAFKIFVFKIFHCLVKDAMQLSLYDWILCFFQLLQAIGFLKFCRFAKINTLITYKQEYLHGMQFSCWCKSIFAKILCYRSKMLFEYYSSGLFTGNDKN